MQLHICRYMDYMMRLAVILHILYYATTTVIRNSTSRHIPTNIPKTTLLQAKELIDFLTIQKAILLQVRAFSCHICVIRNPSCYGFLVLCKHLDKAYVKHTGPYICFRSYNHVKCDSYLYIFLLV